MRAIISTCVIITVIITIGCLSINMLENDTETLGNLLSRIEEEITHNRWEEAVKIQNQLNVQWSKYKKIWPMLIDHADVDKVTAYISELGVFITKKDEIMAASRLAVLKLLMQNIPEKEYVILQNIF